jgi:hypothetical protein
MQFAPTHGLANDWAAAVANTHADHRSWRIPTISCKNTQPIRSLVEAAAKGCEDAASWKVELPL